MPTDITARPNKDAPINWGKSFFFFRDDPAWIKKLVIGGVFGLLSVVFVGVFFLGGYLLRLIAQVTRGAEDELPSWDDLGGIFVDGLKAIGLYMVLTLPVSLIPTALGCLAGFMGSTLDSQSKDTAAGIVVLGMVLISLLIIPLVWIIAFYVPAALTRLALTGRFASGFDWRENFGFIRRNLGSYLLAILLYLAASILAGVGYLACCVGVFVTSFWALCVFGWALGSVARRDPVTADLARRDPGAAS